MLLVVLVGPDIGLLVEVVVLGVVVGALFGVVGDALVLLLLDAVDEPRLVGAATMAGGVGDVTDDPSSRSCEILRKARSRSMGES